MNAIINRIILCLFLFNCQSKAFIVRIDHYYNPKLNQHLFLLSDLHTTNSQKEEINNQQREQILNAAQKLGAHLIVEDMKVFFEEKCPENFPDELLLHHPYERPTFSELLSHPTTFDANVSYCACKPSLSSSKESCIRGFGFYARSFPQEVQDNSKIDKKSISSRAINSQLNTPLLFLKQLADTRRIPCINVECRQALTASLLNYSIASKIALETIDRHWHEINSYNDGPIYKKFYDSCTQLGQKYNTIASNLLQNLRQSSKNIYYNLIQSANTHEFDLLYGEGVNDVKMRIAQADNTESSLFLEKEYAVNTLPNTTANASLLDEKFNNAMLQARSLAILCDTTSILLDAQIIHAIGNLPRNSTAIICAGALHCAGIIPTLQTLGYELLDTRGPAFGSILGAYLNNVSHYIDIAHFFDSYTRELLSSNTINAQNQPFALVSAEGKLVSCDPTIIELSAPLKSALQTSPLKSRLYCNHDYNLLSFATAIMEIENKYEITQDQEAAFGAINTLCSTHPLIANQPLVKIIEIINTVFRQFQINGHILDLSKSASGNSSACACYIMSKILNTLAPQSRDECNDFLYQLFCSHWIDESLYNRCAKNWYLTHPSESAAPEPGNKHPLSFEGYGFSIQELLNHGKISQNIFHDGILDLSHLRINSLDGLENIPTIDYTQVKKLNLSYNCLSKLEPRCLKKFVNLIDVDFSHNRITSIEYGEFDGFQDLENLNLSYNEIRSSSLLNLNSLTIKGTLDLSYNLIEHINCSNLPGFIHTLSLKHNNLSTLNNEDLAIRTVHKIDLSDNKLYSISQEVFARAQREKLVIILDQEQLKRSEIATPLEYMKQHIPLLEIEQSYTCSGYGAQIEEVD